MSATKLTPEISAAIIELVRRGVPIAQAAEHVGVARFTVREWIRRGEGRDDRPSSDVYETFATDLRAARAARLAELLESVSTGAIKDWRAAAWEAERGWPEDFGQRQRLEHTGAGGQPLLVYPSITDMHEAAQGGQVTDAGREAFANLEDLMPSDEERAERDRRHAVDVQRIEALRAERAARSAGAAPRWYLPDLDEPGSVPEWTPEAD